MLCRPGQPPAHGHDCQPSKLALSLQPYLLWTMYTGKTRLALHIPSSHELESVIIISIIIIIIVINVQPMYCYTVLQRILPEMQTELMCDQVGKTS